MLGRSRGQGAQKRVQPVALGRTVWRRTRSEHDLSPSADCGIISLSTKGQQVGDGPLPRPDPSEGGIRPEEDRTCGPWGGAAHNPWKRGHGLLLAGGSRCAGGPAWELGPRTKGGRNRVRRNLFAKGGWLLLAGLVLLLASCGGSQGPKGPEGGLTQEGYPYMGSPDAPVLIEEFSDFQ